MKVYPAIHLLGGKAVCLRQGRRDQVTEYSDDPVALVAEFAAAGAERIHIADLDGAFTGQDGQRELIAAMVAKSPVPVQVGGGIRDLESLEAMFALGARFAVLGTAAVGNRRFAKKACRAYPERIIVAVDCDDNGRVHVEGWAEKSESTVLELATRAILWGAAALLYTSISRSGTMRGPDTQAVAALANNVDMPVIAAGGVASLDDLGVMAARGVPAAIVGTALYERIFPLADAIAAAGGVDADS